MAIPAWYWAASGAAARGTAVIPFGSGALLVNDWTQSKLWPFFASGTFANPIYTSVGMSVAPDGSGNAFFVSYDGTQCGVLASTGTITYLKSRPFGSIYIGAAVASGTHFSVAPNGNVFGVRPAISSLFGTWPTPTISLTASGTTLAGILPASGVGVMNASTSATGLIALPSAIPYPTCLAIPSGYAPLLGGWQNAPALSGVAAAQLDPQNSSLMLAVGSGNALLWGAPSAASEAWSQTQSVTGLAVLNGVAWRPDGTQALATSLVSGAVQVLGYSGGSISLSQTLTVAGATSIAIAGDSTNALVAQSGAAQLATLAYTSTWAVGSPVTGLTGITAVAALGSSGAVAAYGSGLAFVELIGGAWNISSTLALAFAPTTVAVDSFMHVYAAGSGAMAVASGGVLLGSGAWTGGAATSVAVQQGRVLIAVPADNEIRIFGQSAASAWTQQGSAALSLGTAVGLALSDTVLFTMGSGSTLTYGFSGSAYALTPVRSGAIAQWGGSSWTQTALGIGHVPSALTYDASGTAWTVTVQNTLWSLTTGSVLTSGYVPVFSGQSQTVPIGPSAILATSGHIFVATSLAGTLVQTA